MDTIYERLIDEDEKRRVAKIELLDEFEEWHMIMRHYCIVCASFDKSEAHGKEGTAATNWIREVGRIIEEI